MWRDNTCGWNLTWIKRTMINHDTDEWFILLRKWKQLKKENVGTFGWSNWSMRRKKGKAQVSPLVAFTVYSRRGFQLFGGPSQLSANDCRLQRCWPLAIRKRNPPLKEISMVSFWWRVVEALHPGIFKLTI